jgi:hypothetical protein
MIEEVRNIKIEIDYGMHYIQRALPRESVSKELHAFISSALLRMGAAKGLLDRFGLYATSGTHYPYANESNTSNEVIELDPDCVDQATVEVNLEFSKVKHMKFSLAGLDMLIDKLVALRSKPRTIRNPRDMIMAMITLDMAIGALEYAYVYISNALRAESLLNPNKYQDVETVSAIEEKQSSEEVEKNDSIMEERASATESDNETSEEQDV